MKPTLSTARRFARAKGRSDPESDPNGSDSDEQMDRTACSGAVSRRAVDVAGTRRRENHPRCGG
ncbi:hypothetical protein PROAA_860041 [Candidatus Propionivibrio aalborgensis]|uniref:Uncharacterized protein n=1 Tax=Candidatus Propionivibrio aalborgensis TaxID=1860101 RepID=A0A1A8Y3Y0_9RHOO|nr:hypothetical protein PROAA_860041 [Candidatus Propionivibrio aalborgensis]